MIIVEVHWHTGVQYGDGGDWAASSGHWSLTGHVFFIKWGSSFLVKCFNSLAQKIPKYSGYEFTKPEEQKA